MTFSNFLRRLDCVNGVDASHIENLAPVMLEYNVGDEYKPYLFSRSHDINNKVSNFYIKEIRSNYTTSTALRDLSLCQCPTQLCKIKKDDFTYYGNRFIMFDSNFRLLYTYMLKGSNTFYAHRNDEVLFYVSPLVFENCKNYLEKLIITKMIPYYSISEPYIAALNHCKKVTVLIKENNNIIKVKTPTMPSDFNGINKQIKELLIKNYDRYILC